MKRQKTISVLLSICLCCFCAGQEKRYVGVELASAIIYGRASINAGYAFSDRWSADTEISINTRRILDSPETTEREHWSELYPYRLPWTDSHGSYLVCSSIFFTFWPRKAFEGPLICIGGELRDRGGPDLCAGAGYHCRIWKGTCATIMYRIGIKGCLDKETGLAEGLKISIGFVF